MRRDKSPFRIPNNEWSFSTFGAAQSLITGCRVTSFQKEQYEKGREKKAFGTRQILPEPGNQGQHQQSQDPSYDRTKTPL